MPAVNMINMNVHTSNWRRNKIVRSTFYVAFGRRYEIHFHDERRNILWEEFIQEKTHIRK